jgi:uncharacterized UBP type Zn finger protein
MTCFLNALLTSLSAAVPFVDRLLRHLRRHNYVGRNAHCLRCCLANDFALLCQSGRCDPFRPGTADRLLEWAPTFVRGEQQCVGEAFRFLTEAVATEDVNSVEHLGVSWVQARRCLNAACSDTYTQTSHNVGLQLELPPNRITVLELLEEHFRTEQVDDFACELCGVRGPCEVSKTVSRWPEVLVLHVKRFQFTLAGTEKITSYLWFDELLESTHFGVTYSLQAVAEHQGRTLGQGHYVAFVRDSLGQWVCVNDDAPPRPRLRSKLFGVPKRIF